jgi:hypothetical protein
MVGMAKRHPALRVYLWSCVLLLWVPNYISPRSIRTWGIYALFLLIWLPALSYFVMMAIADRGRFGLRTLLIVVTLPQLRYASHAISRRSFPPQNNSPSAH